MAGNFCGCMHPKVLPRTPSIGGENYCDSCQEWLMLELSARPSKMPAHQLHDYVSGGF
jgi:hypothetical protein